MTWERLHLGFHNRMIQCFKSSFYMFIRSSAKEKKTMAKYWNKIHQLTPPGFFLIFFLQGTSLRHAHEHAHTGCRMVIIIVIIPPFQPPDGSTIGCIHWKSTRTCTHTCSLIFHSRKIYHENSTSVSRFLLPPCGTNCQGDKNVRGVTPTAGRYQLH